MMGVQIGGGEWLFGPEITNRYGGALMWIAIAIVAIVLQVFYNIECGRYAMYCGEPIFTGFMRTRPGPLFWIGCIFVLNLNAFIPGLSTHAAAMIAALFLDRPPTHEDSSVCGLDSLSQRWLRRGHLGVGFQAEAGYRLLRFPLEHGSCARWVRGSEVRHEVAPSVDLAELN
jgi:hypothetical protein